MTQGDNAEETQRTLAWVGQNGLKRRRGSVRTTHAGSAVVALSGVLHDRWLVPASAAAEALAPLVDESFRKHCRVAAAAEGRVVITVDAASLVSEMRRRWLSVVREGMKIVDRRLATGTVVFEYGRSGVEVSLA
jgi:hypothetical protein